MNNIVEIIGWIGSVLLLMGFCINIFKNISTNSLLYLLLNFVGSLFLTINAYINKAYPFILVNTFWMIFSLFKIITKNYSKHSD